MNLSFKNPVIRVWLILVTLTLITWLIGMEHGYSGPGGVAIGMTTVLAIAFVKVHLVGRTFMELRSAPSGLKLAFGSWVVGIGAVVIGMYLWEQ